MKENELQKIRDISNKIASIYLWKNKSITRFEIKSLPFVEDESDIDSVIHYLKEEFLLEQEIVHTDNKTFLGFDTKYFLKNTDA